MIPDWHRRYAANMHDYEGYSIGKLLGLINDPEVISLAGGLPSPDMFLGEQLQEATWACFDPTPYSIMQYSPIRGEAALIDAIIAFLNRDNIRLEPENVLITASGQLGLDLVGRLFLNPGDGVIVERPTFAGALAAFQMQRPAYLGADLQDDGIDVDQLEAVLSKARESGTLPKFIYVVPDFQNPSGISMSLAKRRILLDISERFDVPIVEDSPYRTLRYRGESIPSLFSLDQDRGGGRVIGIYTFSKIFCPGMRVGFNIGPPEVMEKMTNIKEGCTLNTPKYNQDMCTAFLREVDLGAYFEDCRNYYRRKLETFLQTMIEHFPPERGVTWTQPDGGMFVWVTTPSAIDTHALFHQALAHKVAFVPGDAFYGEHPKRNHMRINFSFPTETALAEAIRRLSDCLRDNGI